MLTPGEAGAKEVAKPANSSRRMLRFIKTPLRPALAVLGAAALSAGPLSRAAALPPELSLSNAVLSVTLHSADGTLSVEDRRTGGIWSQQAVGEDIAITGAKILVAEPARAWRPVRQALVAKGLRASADEPKPEAAAPRGIQVALRHVPSGLDVAAALELDRDRPELTITLDAKGLLPKPLAYPHPFVTAPGTSLLVPLNEGISYPVDDPAIRPMRHELSLLSMSFCGATDGERGYMVIVETPDDAAIRVARAEDKLCIAPEWIGQKGRFAYPRRLRYVFFDRGGHVAICKRYREHAREAGLLKTLEEKRRNNPNVDRLVGAMDVWGWDKEAALDIAREMRALGMERILWSSVIFGPNELSPETVRGLNDMGFLTARYDNYQETMDPARFDVVKEQATWVTGAWPHDRLLGPGGQRPETWQVKGSDGKKYGCNAVCESQALKYARARIPEQLKTLPYRARFVDTVTAARWRECYDPAHPMTQGDCHRFRVELLRYVSGEMNLVTGSENGRETAVPHAHYFEGMLSLQPYRIPEEGRKPFDIWTGPAPEPVLRYQLGPRYRLPLWELVFHDCVVSHWWWGDCNSSAPAVRELRNLWNVLYGTPPLVHVFRKTWEAGKEQFADTYRRVCPVARATGYAEMTEHRFLAPDRSVQQTVFANGVTVTVNFGEKPFRLGDVEIPPRGHRVEGM